MPLVKFAKAKAHESLLYLLIKYVSRKRCYQTPSDWLLLETVLGNNLTASTPFENVLEGSIMSHVLLGFYLNLSKKDQLQVWRLPVYAENTQL